MINGSNVSFNAYTVTEGRYQEHDLSHLAAEKERVRVNKSASAWYKAGKPAAVRIPPVEEKKKKAVSPHLRRFAALADDVILLRRSYSGA